jgi:CDP-6-deoxy-D-xylo-4-hexulose-3-dehydrase
MSDLPENLIESAVELARSAMETFHTKTPFIPGVTPIPVTGKVFDHDEIGRAVSAALEFWLTAGKHTDNFERGLAKKIGVRSAHMCNSGSSANLIALSSLTSSTLGDSQIRPEDEVITMAAGFPTTVTPIIQNNLVPVFVDAELGTYSPIVSEIEAAISKKTKAIMIAHTLGNPFDVYAIQEIAKRNNLWLIEDSCDAFGTTYDGQNVGTFGDLATLSFYPAHHITTGEGGAVLTKHAKLKPLIESFRDWGRDCWCLPGCDNTCFKRFDWQLGSLPKGFDHKYTYSHLGYNLKSGDIQAAIGLAQLEKVDTFIKARRENWSYLRELLTDLEDVFILPESAPLSNPSWFGFALTIRPGIFVERNEVISYLESKKIATRLLFGGNLLRQPAFSNIKMRQVSSLVSSNLILTNTFWLGVWPGLNKTMLEYVSEELHSFLGR